MLLGSAALAAAVLFAISAGGSSGTYKVRAIFDNASFVVTGEDDNERGG